MFSNYYTTACCDLSLPNFTIVNYTGSTPLTNASQLEVYLSLPTGSISMFELVGTTINCRINRSFNFDPCLLQDSDKIIDMNGFINNILGIPQPSMIILPSSLNLTKHNPNASASQSILLSGADLLGNITITPPSGIEISDDNITWVNSLVITALGSLPNTSIYVRINNSIVEGSYSGNLVFSTQGTTAVNVALTYDYEIFNKIEYTGGNGTQFTQAHHNTFLGITTTNFTLIGDVVYFDNVNYTISGGIHNIMGTGMVVGFKLQSTDITTGGFISLGGSTVPSIIYAEFPQLTDCTSYLVGGCSSLSLLSIPKLKNIDHLNFYGLLSLSTLDAPVLETMGVQNFQSSNIDVYNLNRVTNFGATTGDESNFIGITGRVITLTTKSIHQTSNGGNLEGDLDLLDTNNTVTFNFI